jgi:hypothetical protein
LQKQRSLSLLQVQQALYRLDTHDWVQTSGKGAVPSIVGSTGRTLEAGGGIWEVFFEVGDILSTAQLGII